MQFNLLPIFLVLSLHAEDKICTQSEKITAEKIHCDVEFPSCLPSKPECEPCSFSCSEPKYDLCREDCSDPCRDKMELKPCVTFPDTNIFRNKLMCLCKLAMEKLKPVIGGCDYTIICDIEEIHGKMVDTVIHITKKGGKFLASSVMNVLVNSLDSLSNVIKCTSSEEFRAILRLISETDSELFVFIEKAIDMVLHDILMNIQENTKAYLKDVNDKIGASMDNLYQQIEELVLNPNNTEFPLEEIVFARGDLLYDNIEDYNQKLYQEIEFKIKFLMTTIDNKIERNLNKAFENIVQMLSGEERQMINELANMICKIRCEIMKVKQIIVADQMKQICNVVNTALTNIAPSVEEKCYGIAPKLMKLFKKIMMDELKLCEGYVNYYANQVVTGIRIN